MIVFHMLAPFDPAAPDLSQVGTVCGIDGFVAPGGGPMGVDCARCILLDSRIRIPRERIWQQCPTGRDDNPESFCHDRHFHFTRHWVKVWCRGWFPVVRARRGGMIDYFRT
jgi:hypothetical protein